MKKITLSALLMGSLLLVTASCTSKPAEEPTQGNPTEPQQETQAAGFQITIEDPSEGWKKQFSANLNDQNAPQGKAILDWMQYFHQKDPAGFPLETKEVTGIGVFIESMFGKKNGEEGGKYWMYCVNDTSSPVGAGARILRPGDGVNWYYTLPKELPCKKLGE